VDTLEITRDSEAGLKPIEPRIQLGDVTILSSGGPPMTVVYLTPGCDVAHCLWFDSHGNQCRGDFPTSSLTVTEPSKLCADSRRDNEERKSSKVEQPHMNVAEEEIPF
jgi:uncharacterized protein YodC (DUF2158 family)